MPAGGEWATSPRPFYSARKEKATLPDLRMPHCCVALRVAQTYPSVMIRYCNLQQVVQLLHGVWRTLTGYEQGETDVTVKSSQLATILNWPSTYNCTDAL